LFTYANDANVFHKIKNLKRISVNHGVCRVPCAVWTYTLCNKDVKRVLTFLLTCFIRKTLNCFIIFLEALSLSSLVIQINLKKHQKINVDNMLISTGHFRVLFIILQTAKSLNRYPCAILFQTHEY